MSSRLSGFHSSRRRRDFSPAYIGKLFDNTTLLATMLSVDSAAAGVEAQPWRPAWRTHAFFGSCSGQACWCCWLEGAEFTGRVAVSMPVDDFVRVLVAGRLLLEGKDPYSPELLLQLQRAAGWTGAGPLMMWNPPWTFSLSRPQARPYPFGRLFGSCWLFSQQSFAPIFLEILQRPDPCIDG